MTEKEWVTSSPSRNHPGAIICWMQVWTGDLKTCLTLPDPYLYFLNLKKKNLSISFLLYVTLVTPTITEWVLCGRYCLILIIALKSRPCYSSIMTCWETDLRDVGSSWDSSQDHFILEFVWAGFHCLSYSRKMRKLS